MMTKQISRITLLLLTNVVFAESGETYLLDSPIYGEWKPPVRKPKELVERVVKKAHVIQEGGRHVCLEECEAPIEEPEIEVSPISASRTETTEAIPFQEENYVDPKLIFISATVYQEGEKNFSYIRLQCENQKVEAWSSMNFMEMAGTNRYVARDIEYYTHVGHGMEYSLSASEAGCPVLREKLNREKARFILTKDASNSPDALEALRGLHAIYNKERDSLRIAYQKQLENQEKAAKWHAENPPQPKDITIRFWKRDIQKEEK